MPKTIPEVRNVTRYNPARIFRALKAQKRAYKAKTGLAPVADAALRKYAKSCYRSLRANIKSCETDRDYRKLSRALDRRLGRRTEFLHALDH